MKNGVPNGEEEKFKNIVIFSMFVVLGQNTI